MRIILGRLALLLGVSFVATPPLCGSELPPSVQEERQFGSFRKCVKHLRDLADAGGKLAKTVEKQEPRTDGGVTIYRTFREYGEVELPGKLTARYTQRDIYLTQAVHKSNGQTYSGKQTRQGFATSWICRAKKLFVETANSRLVVDDHGEHPPPPPPPATQEQPNYPK